MLASSRREQRERRGVILILVLGLLALMALVGITFATFSGQSRISARNHLQSMNQPQRDELMDFALAQLISDTPDIRSAIHGHSLARDMYGSDAASNGYLTVRPDNGAYFYITGVTAGTGTQYILTTNILAADPTFYGYNFTRWSLRIAYTPATFANNGVGMGTGVISQTLEILADSGYNPGNNGYRTFTVNIGYSEGNYLAASTGIPPTPATYPTSLINPTAGTITQMPGEYLVTAAGGTLGGVCQFILDGRWLHAFNGPGMTTNAVHANFRFNGQNPNSQGMDEDYDAVDLENWFLAMQSADGSVMIPSFHRPSAIRNDATLATLSTAVYDWGGPQNAAFENAAAGNWADSASRILRPRAADGHDAATFPDLVPGSNGQITYDVDNDGDGVTDSVWLDLGYPARRNAQGQLYKPLFSFMVIGLNGRIPLNTAGNLAGTATGINYPLGSTSGDGTYLYTYGNGASHAAHLGNSVSEVDPTYGLQNGFDATDVGTDNIGAFTSPAVVGASAYNTQVDSAGLDVRLTQLRNILAGTRPPQKDSFGSGTDADTNYVFLQPAKGSPTQSAFVMPNSVADYLDKPVFGTDTNGYPVVQRLTPPVAGRWGEPGSIPGGVLDSNSASPPAISNYLNLVQVNYDNPVRAGYSYDVADAISTAYDSGTTSGLPRDAADDNYNAFDPFPLGHTGEVNDSDSYDAAGALILPVDRMRRYVTPADINGTGTVKPWSSGSITGNTTKGTSAGADPLGRVLHSSYYRPPGSPGSIATAPSTPVGGTVPAGVGTLGAIYYPSSSAAATNYFYTQGPNNNYPGPMPAPLAYPDYLPDVTNNPLHAFEFFKMPPVLSNLTKLTATAPHVPVAPFTFQFQQQRNPAMPIDGSVDAPPQPPWTTTNPTTNFPISFPTYDYGVNAKEHTDGLNDADEMNLYTPNLQIDAAFGASDLEWLYRQQDVDGASLTSRLQYLAPVSFTNNLDSQRRRRLYSLDTWEFNNFVWANDNPGNAFTNNKNFTSGQNASFAQLSLNQGTTLPTPALAHRDKKINLNYPLPVSNDPNELVRQKWISDAYQLMKAILPPKAVDTPDELAALSQFLINVVDFRDPDCTMTHFRNPDVKLVLGSITGAVYSPSYLAPIGTAIPAASTAIPLDQFGMEYNPIAINETIAYSFQTGGTPARVNRFLVEMVNTLSQSAISMLPANDLGAGINNPPEPSLLDLSLANYDLVIANDDPVSRPDPFTGQLQPIATAKYYGQMPFNQASAATNPLFSTPGDVQLSPLFAAGQPGNTPIPGDFPGGYFYVIGNPPNPTYEKSKPPAQTVQLSTAYDPMNAPGAATPLPANVVPPGYCPNQASVTLSTATPPQVIAGPVITGKPNTLPGAVPTLSAGGMQYYWVCLRRPANPFAPPQPDITLADPVTGRSTYNPMVVVDAMRFPYIEANLGGATLNALYSAQRNQPFRGGHAVRLPGDTGTTTASPLYTPYGYSEQMGAPATQVTTNTVTNATGAASKGIWHTLTAQNDNSEPWDYFAFNDRDFTSVAELMLVPGCPPGLFTKQFVELAPMPPAPSPTVTTVTGPPAVTLPVTQFPVSVPPPNAPTAPTPTGTAVPSFNAGTASIAFPAGAGNTAAVGATPTGIAQPHTYPYLVDKFFYTGYGAKAGTGILPPDLGNLVDGYGADGWFKMFDFFEVPSQSLGSIGLVAQGTDFDWARQDLKPGLLNLNLIIDEEVFFSVLGSQTVNLNNSSSGTDPFTQQLLNFAQLPVASTIPVVATQSLANGVPNASTAVWGFGGSHPAMVASDPVNGGFFNGMKAAFAQFLALRHWNSASSAASLPLFTANAERPFHSLSYPDINYTIMRPANLPPATTSLPTSGTAYPPTAAPFYTQDWGIRNPYINPSSPPSGILSGTSYIANTPAVVTPPTASSYGAYFMGPTGPLGSYVTMPSPIPARRLFQIPDAYTNGSAIPPQTGNPQTTGPPYAVVAPAVASAISNASDSGDPFVNYVPLTETATLATTPATIANFAIGALAPVLSTTSGTVVYLNNGYPNLVWSGNVTMANGNGVGTNYLGANNGNSAAATSYPDNSQHPYWRSEMMQKVMNLTTVRTHQYAVWITVGFFQVKREGDLGNLAQGNPILAFDLLGPEVGAASGATTRYRGFFLVDRTKLYGFDDTTPGSFRPAVLYRQMIE